MKACVQAFIAFWGLLLVLDELAGLQVVHGLIQLGLGVHHDGAVPRNRLLERLA